MIAFLDPKFSQRQLLFINLEFNIWDYWYVNFQALLK